MYLEVPKKLIGRLVVDGGKQHHHTEPRQGAVCYAEGASVEWSCTA